MIYVIATPPFTERSAGVRALHRLAHELRDLCEEVVLSGRPFGCTWMDEDRYIVFDDPSVVVIYPEVVRGNPLGARNVVRWVLNYPGKLGGDATYPPSEMPWGYTEDLSRAAGAPKEQTLWMPTINTTIFHPPTASVQREGIVYYAHKFRLAGHTPGPEVEGCFEITNHKPDSLRQHEVAALLRRSKWLYLYEDSILLHEAILCGCPVVQIPSDYFRSAMGSGTNGGPGYAWGLDPKDMERAMDTVTQGAEGYLREGRGAWWGVVKFHRAVLKRFGL